MTDARTRLDALLGALVHRNGQDLHLSAGAPPSLRIDTDLVRMDEPVLTPADIAALIDASLTPAQHARFVQDMELDYALSVDGLGRFRCNAYCQRGTLAFTARYVHEIVPSAEELRLPAFLAEFAVHAQGLVLFTGPNGHGKSTTLAWMVEAINQRRRANIITIEDPIEYQFKHALSNVNQREVGTDTKSFAEGLRHIVRQNPDVIVIGELRDRESIQTALTAAETGHLVLGTMHTMNATSAIDRIVDFFPGESQGQVRAQLAESMLLVLSQRLLKKAHGPGRVVAWERMSSSLRVKNAIREARMHVLRAQMQSNLEELIPIEKSLAELVGSGVVAHEEAARYAESTEYLDDLVRIRRESHKHF